MISFSKTTLSEKSNVNIVIESRSRTTAQQSRARTYVSQWNCAHDDDNGTTFLKGRVTG